MAISVGLNSAIRALLTQQQAMDAVAHNVANVNTPGYSRQRVHLAAVAPATGGVGQGVEMLNLERVRDLFVDFQIRTESHAAGEYGARADSLSLVELAFGEPSDNGLRAILGQFFNAWRDLANAPEQSAARSAVVQAGETLAFAANRLATSLGDIRADANTRLSASVREVNDLAGRIAALNGSIVQQRATGDPAADLTDQRDLALDRLAQLTDIRVMEHEGGRVDVFMGGRALVSGVKANAIDLEVNPLNQNFFDVQWAADGATVRVSSGEIGGLLHQRDVDIPARLADLDTLITRVIDDVNLVHAAGFALDGVTTGTAFFTGTDAATIGVNVAIAGNLGLVAAASAGGAAGDGSGALAVADLQATTSLTGGSETYDAFFNGMITRLGVSVRDAHGISGAQGATIRHLEQLRSSVSGVSLDEEMVNLVQFQKGYEAAARVIRAIDEMVQQTLQMVG
ncbi:MAG: flagellar hook-associated protein FlgK [Dehalococcoidia bacterium]|nr:flagellar hook-associated protein FlgK [Dehalococcoidia bacterium]